MAVDFVNILVSNHIHVAIMSLVHSRSWARANHSYHLLRLICTVQIFDAWNIVGVLPNSVTVWVHYFPRASLQVVGALRSSFVSK